MHSSAVDLLVNATATGAYVTWKGGRTALVLAAAAFGTTVQLQLLAQDGATAIPINSVTYSANQVTTYDLPAGQYRMSITGGTTTAMYAKLVSVPYG